MTTDSTEADDPASTVRREIAAAEVGSGDLCASVDSLGAVGDVEVAGEQAVVTITLPVPSAPVRRRIETEIGAVNARIPGVETVGVEWNPSVVDSAGRVDFLPEVKNVVAVASGKGGVGKSTVAANLAVLLAETGVHVGLIDADVYGPSAPAMLGLSDATPRTTHDDRILPREGHSVKVMSMGFIVGEDDPVIWRGPLVDDTLMQLFDDVAWGSLDYLIVDLPPGTGDSHLSICQHVPVTGAVVVTTPASVAVDDARRSIRLFERQNVPVLGIVENMATFECPDCGSDHEIFGAGGAGLLSEEFGVPGLGSIPIDPDVGQSHDEPDGADSRGLTFPGLTRLQLPKTRAEREGRSDRQPIVRRHARGPTRDALARIATRVTAQVARHNATSRT